MDAICYVDEPSVAIALFLCPLIVASLTMAICSFLTVYLLNKMFRSLSPKNGFDVGTMSMESSSFAATYGRMDEYARLTFIRLIVLPIIYLTLAAVNLVYMVFFYDSKWSAPAIASSCCTIISPIINVVVWVLVDQKAMIDWRDYLTGKSKASLLTSVRESAFDGPQSEYGPNESIMELGASPFDFSARPSAA